MRDSFHAGINTTRYSVLFDHKLTKLFSIENFSGTIFHAGKVLIIIVALSASGFVMQISWREIESPLS